MRRIGSMKIRRSNPGNLLINLTSEYDPLIPKKDMTRCKMQDAKFKDEKIY